MISFDWNLIFNTVFSILTALGIFEAIKRILFFWLDNNLIKRNLEIRAIAERALSYCNDLKLINFQEPLSLADRRQLRLDVTKVDSWNKQLGDELMELINYPFLIKTFHENSKHDPTGEYLKLMVKYHTEIHDKVDKLVIKLNKLRYKPIIEFPYIGRILKKKFFNSPS